MSLPRYAKECKVDASGRKLKKEYLTFMRILKQNSGSYDMLMSKIPEALGSELSLSVSEKVKDVKKTFDNLIGMLELYLINVSKEIFAIESNVSNIQKMTLTSVVKDWCESLDESTFEELFNDGTDRCLALFKNVSNDEIGLVSKLAQLATDLRIEDWDDKTASRYLDSLNKWKNTAEAHQTREKNADTERTGLSPDSYEITFVDDEGCATTKRFKKTEATKRGQLLRNQITSAVDSMGQSISEQEKRQILLEILKGMC